MFTATHTSDCPPRAPQCASSAKVVTLADLEKLLPHSREGRTVVQCHGVFDLLHIGHIKHLESARDLGDVLVVTVTADRFVNKGPGRPIFSERLRAEAVASLGCVDLVVINDSPSALEAIRRIGPDLFVKGAEYRDAEADHSGHITTEREAVESVGGQLVFTGDITFSSSNLINRHMSALPEATRDYLESFRQRHPIDDVLGYLRHASDLSVLVVGEAIIDEYQYCQAIGKSSKEPVLAVKQVSAERFAGGILAVGNHVAPFAGRTDLVTVLGKDDAHEQFVRENLDAAIKPVFLFREDGPTIVKRRFIDRYFFQKLFEVYECNDARLAPRESRTLCETLDHCIDAFDIVLVVDFGHGMIGADAVELLARRSRYLAVNAQSNAANLGYHTVSKYPRADLVCVSEKEIRLEARDPHGDLRPLVQQVSRTLECPSVLVTRGSNGCLCYDRDRGFVEVPALATQVTDRMGAGDTFISIASLCAAQGAPLEVVGLIGNAAGAQAVATVGHRHSLQRVGLLKHLECLLK